MFYDERHPHLSLVFLMVLEAMQHPAEQIVLTRKEEFISVVFSSSNKELERDQIPNRFWHSILSVLHCLAGETVCYNPEGNSNFFLPDTANTEFNSILISEKFPKFKNGFLTELRETVALPFHLELSFADRVVTITIKQQKQ
ncbi:hypothetical protein [Gimesia panareensis]|uniref:Uncharacterized protein n=1 Tax=Gimesia panareensis TaxID=2527978 RepID=A0A517QD14_9PLAN|nr:hypothetical protein [Gimesia panareensis]QDT29526.1 hypothetical protein Enr10x_48810 [Gimesia panareensis]QDU52569.1 hypothetical protein Pan110_49490 [Gimesia panareensis]